MKQMRLLHFFPLINLAVPVSLSFFQNTVCPGAFNNTEQICCLGQRVHLVLPFEKEHVELNFVPGLNQMLIRFKFKFKSTIQ